LEDGPRFAPLIREIITEMARRNNVDRDRIYVAGCSNGGYMSMKITAIYPDLFAASVPICGVVQSLQPGGQRQISDAELASISSRPGSSPRSTTPRFRRSPTPSTRASGSPAPW
jgi:poly(3-hydroxybutyrate) depolymerase